MKKRAACSFAVGVILACLSGCSPSGKPVADFSVDPATGTVPLSVTFTNLSTGGGPFAITWEWDFGDGSSLSNEQSPSHAYAAPGSYSVTLRMDTWLGKAELTKAAAVVVSAVRPTAAFDATPRTGTAPVEVQFTDASVAGTDAITGWLWDFGDQATSTEQNPKHRYTAAGGYTVKLTVTAGASSSTATKAGFVLVNPGTVQTPTLARTFSVAQYVPGATVDVTLTLDYPAADITALGITEQIPADWTFQGVVGGTAPSLAHIDPATGALELLYVTVPQFPFGLTYRLLAPAAASGLQTFIGKLLYRTDGPQLETGVVLSSIDAQPTVEGEGEGEGEGEAQVVDGVYNADFSTGTQGWEAGFADLPADYNPSYWQLESGLRAVPVYTFAAASALYIAGNNHSDDLFMYCKRHVSGLEPNTEYRVEFQPSFFSPYRQGSVGIGGSPADSVYLKAGASTVEPLTVVQGEDWLAMNIDKGNQAVAGANAVVLGTIGKPDDGTDNYAMLVKESSESFTATTDAGGGLWLFFGTDSGFEGATSLYYTAFKATFSAYTPPLAASATLLTVKHTTSGGDSYTPGQNLEVTLHVDRIGDQPVTSLSCLETLPSGWTYHGLVSGPFPETAPSIGDGAPHFVWTSFVPRIPFTITYSVTVPADQTGIQDLSGFLMYNTGSSLYPSANDLIQLRPTTGNDTFVSLARQVNPPGVYYPGQPVDITLRFEKHGDQLLYGLVGSDTIPAGWTVQSVDGASPPPIWKVLAGGAGVEYGWVTVPTFPVEFTYHLLPPVGAAGMVQIFGKGLYRFSGPQLETNTEQVFLVPGMIR